MRAYANGFVASVELCSVLNATAERYRFCITTFLSKYRSDLNSQWDRNGRGKQLSSFMATDENDGVSGKVGHILLERCNQPPWSWSGHGVGRWPWLTLCQFCGQHPSPPLPSAGVHCWCYLLQVFTLSRVLAVSPMSAQSCCQCGYTELLFWFAFLLHEKKSNGKRLLLGEHWQHQMVPY